MKPEILRAMLEAGCTAEQIVRAAEKAEEAEKEKQATRRLANAERQRRFRDRNRSNALHGVTERYGPSSEGSSPTPPSPNLQPIPPSPPKGGSSPTPKAELEAVLDADHAEAVIQHRQKIRKPLTAHAAKLLAGKFRQCPNPNAAADAMIANGWQGFEPSWLENRVGRQSQAPPRERTILDAINERLEREDAARHEPPTIDHEPITGPTASADICFLATSPGRRW